MRGCIRRRYKNSYSIVLDLGYQPDPKRPGQLMPRERLLPRQAGRPVLLLRTLCDASADHISASERPIVIIPGKDRGRFAIEGENDSTLELRNGWHLKLVQEVQLHDPAPSLRLKSIRPSTSIRRSPTPNLSAGFFGMSISAIREISIPLHMCISRAHSMNCGAFPRAFR
jgi:hypothetical protein